MQSKLTIPICLRENNLEIALADYQDKATIYHGVGSHSFIWIINEGYVKFHRTSVQGRQATLSILGRGAIFGTIEANQNVSGEIASAQGGVKTYRIEVKTFDKLLFSDVDFAQFVARSLSRRNDVLQRRLFYVMHRKVESRLAAILCDLVQNEGERCTHGCDVDVRLTQQDFADMVGASRQVVSSTLNRLRERQIVQYSRDFICVNDVSALATLAEN
jgi:CRP/FNR family cyclic AMP-dependent transcriptional regulator